MLKIAHYNYNYLNLTENWIYTQVKALEKLGVKQYFYAFEEKNKSLFNLPYVKTVLRENPSYLQRRLHGGFYPNHPLFYYWMARDKPDVVHAHFGNYGYDFLDISRFFKIPMIVSFYGHDAFKLPRKCASWSAKYKKLSHFADVFLIEGPSMKNKLEKLGFPKNKLKIHNIGIDLYKYKFRPRVVNGRLKLLTVGRFVEKKRNYLFDRNIT